MTTRWVPAVALLLLVAAACSESDTATSSTATEPLTTTTAITTLAPTTTARMATTTTAAPTTTVAAATTTPSTTTPAAPTTTAQVSPGLTPQIALRPDGLGPFDFGDPAELVEAELVALLGPPAGEGEEFGRVVYWDGLWVEFGFAEYDEEATVDYFSGWLHSGPGRIDLTTADGIRPGSTIRDLRVAFGDQLDVPSEPSDCSGSWNFNVRFATTADREYWYFGDLSGDPTDPSTTVSWIGSGSTGWNLC